MSAPPTLNTTFDALVQWAMTPEHQDDVVAARAEYSQLAGDVFDEDRQLELRLAGFLEFYLCDRPAPWADGTPARTRYLEALQRESPAQAAAWRAFTETWHGLFQVKGLSPGVVRVVALSARSEVVVSERRAMHGLSVGDVLEARLVPFAGALAFSSAWVWHPHEAASLIVAEAERRRTSGLPERELIYDCARRSLKADRYRQIAIERIYDFSAK
ncbi:MAG: hypothetical protein Q8L14_03095 [Myxococcales bacterium]|nr:hypothetical protein [Myxococcales bacterium]